MGFKEYDELIFAKNATVISPFTTEQWNLMMHWYKIMSSTVGCLILIVVVIISYKIIVSGYSVENRNEAKDTLMRLFFGAVAIIFAPIFVKFLLFLNNNLVNILLGHANGSLNDIIGNKILTNIQTGNAIATAIVIAMFAYLFVKLNVKFIIRQFTILIFTLFTPIVAIMWMINKRTIGASIWFGQILINVFMQFIYAFLFLVYMQFLPKAGGWAISLLWAMMILPLADTLQNTLQNLISRVAGIDNEELSNRGIGMAGEMAHSVKTIAYQFKTPENRGTNSSIIERMLNNENMITNTVLTPMQTIKMDTIKMQTAKLEAKSKDISAKEDVKENNKTSSLNIPGNIINNKQNISNKSKSVYNAGKEFMNMGMYMADGRNLDNSKDYKTRYNFNKNNKQKENTRSVIANMKVDDEV